jgi:hypothetical protein
MSQSKAGLSRDIGNQLQDRWPGEIADGRGRLLQPGYASSNAHPAVLENGGGDAIERGDEPWPGIKVISVEAKVDAWPSVLAI